MKHLLFYVLLLFIVTTLSSQEDHNFPDQLSEELHGLKFRNIGPYRGGRSNTVSGVVGDPMTYYMGTVGGGVYKTKDAGISWKNITDGQLATGSTGAIAVSESDPNVIYLGMGEHAIRGVMTSYGDGVYKSTDAGKTWNHIGLPISNQISRIRIHPNNPDVVYVAVQGAVFGPTQERGIYKSIDGGKHWEQILFVNNTTGAADISMDMNNPRILYAAMWDYQRFPWTVKSGGEGSGIYKSIDGGLTWDKLSKGLPKSMGKVAVDVSRANSEVVYANIEADKGGVYKSTDAGKSWRRTCSDRITITRAWYYIEIYADPQDENIVYVMNAPFLKSIDGGKTFKNIRVPHGDQHDLWINPDNNTNMINANDGGGNISFNQGGSWSAQDNQMTAQFYRVITDNKFPYRIYGGQQDNSSVSIMSRTNSFAITDKHWTRSAGGESAFLAFDENNPQRIYGGTYQGNISHYDVTTDLMTDIMAYPVMGLGSLPSEMKYRFNWNAPIVVSPQNPTTIYHGGNHVLKTSNNGQSWEEISPDLTLNDKDKQGPGGIPFTNEAAGGENYNTISYIAASPHDQGLLYVGTDDGLVHITKDEGASWKNITPAGLKESLINTIEISPHDPGTVFLSITRYKWEDKRPMIYISTDYGTSWTQNNNGIHQDAYVRVVREDKKIKGLLYAGTERGLYISNDNGNQWHPLQLNLPISPINDLTIRDNDLVVATSGRAFWVLDDLSAIQHMAKDNNKTRAYIISPKPTYKYGLHSASKPLPGFGQNPLPGVILDYHLPLQMDSFNITIDITDDQDKIIRSYSNKKNKEIPKAPLLPTKKGINRFNWNMATANLPSVKGLKFFQGLGGHYVPPGNYIARLIVDNDTTTAEITILAYPEVNAPQSAHDEQYEFLNNIADVFTETHESVNKINAIKKQLITQKGLIKELENVEDLIVLNDTITSTINEWLEHLIQPKQKTFQDIINFPNQLNAELVDLIGRTDGLIPNVSEGNKLRFKDLSKQWSIYKGQMASKIIGPLRSYNKLYKKSNIPSIIIPKK